jgi:hypothetical protein
MAEYYKHLVSLEQTPGISGRFTEADGKKLGAEIALYTQHLQLQSNKN